MIGFCESLTGAFVGDQDFVEVVWDIDVEGFRDSVVEVLPSWVAEVHIGLDVEILLTFVVEVHLGRVAQVLLGLVAVVIIVVVIVVVEVSGDSNIDLDP